MTSNRAGCGPDNTLVTFIFHCLGSAVSKLNQLVFTSSTSCHDPQGKLLNFIDPP